MQSQGCLTKKNYSRNDLELNRYNYNGSNFGGGGFFLFLLFLWPTILTVIQDRNSKSYFQALHESIWKPTYFLCLVRAPRPRFDQSHSTPTGGGIRKLDQDPDSRWNHFSGIYGRLLRLKIYRAQSVVDNCVYPHWLGTGQRPESVAEMLVFGAATPQGI